MTVVLCRSFGENLLKGDKVDNPNTNVSTNAKPSAAAVTIASNLSASSGAVTVSLQSSADTSIDISESFSSRSIATSSSSGGSGVEPRPWSLAASTMPTTSTSIASGLRVVAPSAMNSNTAASGRNTMSSLSDSAAAASHCQASNYVSQPVATTSSAATSSSSSNVTMSKPLLSLVTSATATAASQLTVTVHTQPKILKYFSQSKSIASTTSHELKDLVRDPFSVSQSESSRYKNG